MPLLYDAIMLSAMPYARQNNPLWLYVKVRKPNSSFQLVEEKNNKFPKLVVDCY